MVVRHALLSRVGEEPLGRQPHQTLFRPHPEVSFPILEQRVDFRKWRPFVIELGKEPAFAESIQAAVGAHPKISLAILANRANKGVGETIPAVVGVEVRPVPAIPKHPIVGPNPDPASLVLTDRKSTRLNSSHLGISY